MLKECGRGPAMSRVGRTAYAIVLDPAAAGRALPCLKCGQPFTVEAAVLAMVIGVEVIGHFCAQCLSPTTRALLAAAHGDRSPVGRESAAAR